MKHIIHIHQQNLRKDEPAIIDRTYKGSVRSRDLDIMCMDCGKRAAVVVQSSEPDRCGARAWIEADETG